MDILVVAGYCLKVNSSANLCHLAYLKGLKELGHRIDLVTVSEKGLKTDPSIEIPEGINVFEYPASLYERLSYKRYKNTKVTTDINVSEDRRSHGKRSIKSRMLSKLKEAIHKSYGVHGTVSAWCRYAMNFKSDKQYDYVISLAHPPISHVLVYKLKKKKRIKYEQWIQIWEDPWTMDYDSDNRKRKVYLEEQKILSYAEKVLYVSPLTLLYQKELFPEYSEKMFWQPLPTYYEARLSPDIFDKKTYGYFGEYDPKIRNLRPFYEAAEERGIEVNICGNHSNLFEGTDTISIHPRLLLKELALIENKTNVLVFLCNKKGGQIPGKIYQYSASNKIILFVLDGTEKEKKIIKEYFEKYKRYVFCDNRKDAINEAIDKIEKNEFHDISNCPITDFAPASIIEKILT